MYLMLSSLFYLRFFDVKVKTKLRLYIILNTLEKTARSIFWKIRYIPVTFKKKKKGTFLSPRRGWWEINFEILVNEYIFGLVFTSSKWVLNVSHMPFRQLWLKQKMV